MPSTTANSGKSKSKPYSRPLPTASSSKAIVGAPSTHTQTSRKGKKAWRKNIDIRDEEEALEQVREEERATGGKISGKKDGELFTIDTVGDVEVAKKMRRAPKPLRSLAVLSETTAVPSLTSRTGPARKVKSAVPVPKAERNRLRQAVQSDLIVGGKGKGKGKAEVPLEDAWVAQKDPVKRGTFGEEGMVKHSVKPPPTLASRRAILQMAIESGRIVDLPTGGTSYNPSAESHTALLEEAVQEELGLLQKESVEEEKVKQLGEVVVARKLVGDTGELAEGMAIGPGEDDEEVSPSDGEEVNDEVGGARKKATVRKTQAQRNKALRQRREKEQLEIQLRDQKLHNSLSTLSASKLRKEAEKRDREQREAERLAKFAKKERERLGLVGGEKVGRHRVQKGRVEVQLGEDLAESLRQVKPEGNLFKDRYLALQKRGLVEPRVAQMNKRTRKTKEYEKHAYKRFV